MVLYNRKIINYKVIQFILTYEYEMYLENFEKCVQDL
jgi:hypothetical protein